MYGRIWIKHRGFTRSFRTLDNEYVYNYLRCCGCDHEEAADIADWAENAPIGAEYLPGDPGLEIWISE